MRGLAWILALALALLAGCRTIRESVEVERPVVVHDTIMQASLQTDSLYVRDSVYVEGQTIYKERVYWRSRTLTDTIYVVRTDTVTVTKTVTRTEERGRSWPWWAGALAILFFGLVLIRVFI